MVHEDNQPDMFLTYASSVVRELAYCKHCGSTATIAHHKYTDKCDSCGNRYNLFHVRRSARLKNELTNRKAFAHLQLLEDLVVLRDRGFEPFPGLDEEYHETRRIVDNIHALKRREAELIGYKSAPCAWCGTDVRMPANVTKPAQCQDCQGTYERFVELKKGLDTLPALQRTELAALISYYVTQKRHGFKAPYVNKVAERLQKLQKDEGLPGFKIYGGDTI